MMLHPMYVKVDLVQPINRYNLYIKQSDKFKKEEDIITMDEIQYDALGNIIGMDIPEFNRITIHDTTDVIAEKQRVQREQWNREH